MARLMAFPMALVLVLAKPVGRLETSGLAATMEFLPIGLPQPISPGEWGNTPASIQALVKSLLAERGGGDQSILVLKAQIQREKALNRVVQAIRNSLDLDIIFATATAEAAQLMAPLDCYVSQYVAEADLWRTVAEYRHDASLPPTLGFEIPDAGNPFSAQLRRLEMVCLDDTDAVDDEINRSVARTTPGAWLLTPIAVEGQIWGSFALVAHQRPFSWGSDQIELSQAIAHQLEVAIQQANLYRQVQLELKERRRVETALQESQARGQAVAANLPGAIFRYRLYPDGTDSILYMSPGCNRLWEVEAATVVADASILWAMVHPDDRPAMYASVLASAQALTPWNFAWRITTPAGAEKWLEATGQPMHEPDGSTLWDTLVLDVTDRRTAQRALEVSEQRFDHLADNVPGVIYGYCLRPDGSEQFTYISSGFREIYGFEPEVVLEDAGVMWRTLHPDDVALLQQSIEASRRHLETWRVEYRAMTATGQIKWLQGIARPTAQANGDVIWDGLLVDISDRKQAEAALAASEQKLSTLIGNLPGYVYRVRNDPNYTPDFISQGVEAITGYAVEEYLVSRTISCGQEIHPGDAERVWNQVQQGLASRRPYECEYRLITKAGAERWVWERGQGTYDSEDTLLYLEGFVTDISSQKQAEAALRESEARYRLLAENTNDLVCLHNCQGEYLYVSPSCHALLGYHYEEMRGQILDQFVHPDDGDRLWAEVAIAVAGDKANPVTYRVRHRQGHYLWFETLIRAITNGAGQVVQLQTTSRDVTDRVRTQQQLEHDALHDGLTGLPNRHHLMDCLSQALARSKADPSYCFGVLFLDLDRFKVINDSLGHLAGDQLLIAIAAKLKATLGLGDLAARLGGDEFVVLMRQFDPATNPAEAAIAQAERIFAALVAPFIMAGREIYATVSIGVVLGHRGYGQAEHLLRDADIAMYRAKAQGKARYAIFDAHMHTQAVARLHLENDLRRAIAQGKMLLHYQPIVALDQGTVVGFEALTRWQHPTQGIVPPCDFIPLAEELGLISRLDYWAMATACQQMARWQRQFPALGPLTISVNLSAQDLRQPDLLVTLDRVLSDSTLPGPCLILEITESMLIDDIEATIDLLAQIQARGVQISIDDFGTGYSSLSYLHRLPVNYLKVDRSFVAQAQSGQPNHPIVATIMALGNQLGLATIAEGVETDYQCDHLRQLGYDLGQGYLFSPPLEVAAVAHLLALAAQAATG